MCAMWQCHLAQRLSKSLSYNPQIFISTWQQLFREEIFVRVQHARVAWPLASAPTIWSMHGALTLEQ